MTDFSCKTARAGQTTIISVKGDLDMATAVVLEEAIARARADGATSLVIDMAEVSFIDSSGINTLVVVHRSCSESGGAIAIAEPGPRVAELLRLTELDKRIPIVERSSIRRP